MNVVVKKSKVQGKGVYANEKFKEGDVILGIDDTHVVPDASKLTPKQHEFDCDYLADGKVILMQPPEKFINHSCEPSSYVKTIGGIRKVVAMRDIKKGEEITYDYSINGDNEGAFKCNCGSKKCRGVYQGNFFKLPLKIQYKYLSYLDDWFVEKHKNEIDELLKTRK
jgi:SET domain-containing protein